MSRRVKPLLRLARPFDIIGLIDIIFLLLVFGMLVMATSYFVRKQEEQAAGKKQVSIIFDRLSDDDGPSRSIVSVRYPAPEAIGMDDEELPPDDDLEQLVRTGNHERHPAFRLIRTTIEAFWASEGFAPGERPDHIELKVHDSTRFCLIGYVVDRCGAMSHDDTTAFWLDITGMQ